MTKPLSTDEYYRKILPRAAEVLTDQLRKADPNSPFPGYSVSFQLPDTAGKALLLLERSANGPAGHLRLQAGVHRPDSDRFYSHYVAHDTAEGLIAWLALQESLRQLEDSVRSLTKRMEED